MLTFDRAKILGTGGFGIVYEGVWSGNTVAVKRIPIHHVATNEQEENALKILDHINVNKLLHVEKDQDFKYFALELCFASSDKLFLKENDSKKCRVSMPPKQEILLQLAKGLKYIHEMKLVHRDITPQNVLIFIDPENQQVVMKWGDFGLSKQVNKRGTFTMTNVTGKYNYLAPEILKLIDEGSFDDNDEKKRGIVKSDVFAEGLVFGYFVSDGVHPFGAVSDHQIAVNVRTKRPINLPKRKETRSLIEKMLEKKPENRISSAEVVNQLMNIKKNSISNLLKRRNANYPCVEEFNILKQEGIDIDVDERGLTTLLHLVFENNKKTGDVEGIARFLIQNGADVNSKDEKGRNALQILFGIPFTKIFLYAMTQLLIENGIDVNCKDNDGWNALPVLCRYHKNENLIDIVRLLIENGIDVNSKNKDGWNALHYLCRYYKNENLIEIIRLLIGKEIGINSKNNYGSNALHELCTNYENDNLIDIIQLLIENGIEVTSETLNYFTKNYYKEDHNEILQLLGSKEDEARPAKRMKFN